jgi:hypothetical protein
MDTLTSLRTWNSRNHGTETTFPAYRREVPVSDGIAQVREARGLEFVTGAPAAPEFIWVKGYKIRQGAGLLSEPQAKFIVDIAETREGVTQATVEALSHRLEQGFAKQAASQFITNYSKMPRKTVAQTTTAKGDAFGVTAGYYALRIDGVVKFYRVTEGKGRWAGRTFLEAQASDEKYPIRNAEKRQEILKLIVEAPLEAQQLYGRELGRCARCGRTLTDETSRAYGMDPECRSK